jgi:acetyl esterase/lipase
MPALAARKVVEEIATGLEMEEVERVPGSLMLTPFRRTRAGVEVIRDIEFFRAAGRSLKLDVFQQDAAGDNRPALIYVHGGGWVFGDKKDQGLPLCNHLASLGWVCFNINYRLSPGATWPEHLIDAKAAVAWVREHAADYGVDPRFISISGGSAGAQIAAMLVLTQGEESFQPGFEDEDASVQAVVTSYGVYDLTNRLGAHNPEFVSKMIGPLVVKADIETEPEKFANASPRDHTEKADIPWLVIHGDADELAPAIEARDFFDAMSNASPAMSAYAELPGASHAFDIYYCHRTNATVDLTARFLATARSSSNDA